jgi:hypothetical protein
VTGSKPGSPPKGSDIINQVITNRVPKKQRGAVKKAVKEEIKKEVSEKQRNAIKKAQEALAIKRELIKTGKYIPPPEKEKPEDDPGEDQEVDGEVLTKKEAKLKNDLLWVLKKMGGRNKILQMAKKSDALKITIIKELLKVEVKELEARLRSKEKPGGGGAGFYFCLANLGDTKKLEGSGMNMKFLGNALNPTEPVPIDIENDEEEIIEP